MGELAARRLGSGPALVLVHGGAGPERTWERQEALADRWQLVIPWRRGFEPSPPARRQDFDADADDLIELAATTGPAHLVGFSYGGLGCAIAAGRRPDLVRTLTLIEPPFFALAVADPEVASLVELSTRALAGGDERSQAAFFALAGLDRPESAAELERAIRLARGLRPPLEAAPEWEAIVTAKVPSLVVSGGHSEAIERVCDALAERLAAQRERLPGAGHPAQRAPGFNRVLVRHVRAGEARSGSADG